METWRITKELRFAMLVDGREEPVPSEGRVLEPGEEFYIFRDKHDWGVDPNGPKFPTYTIQVRGEGRHYNVLANLLEPRMERIDPPTASG